jgi:hypothetical protein
MTIQWPTERESANRQFNDNSIDPKEELPRLLADCSSGLPVIFDNAVEWITQQGDDTSELERRMSAVSDELELSDFPESVNLLMAWACAKALEESPSLQTWQNVRKLQSSSWQLEHGLSDAMMIYAERENSAKEAYIKLAKEVFAALDDFQLTSQFDRHNKEREQFRASWDENCAKLDLIWQGLHWWNEMNYEEEFPLFRVLGNLDAAEFMDVISQSKDPYLVKSVLSAVGTWFKFSLWKTFAASAPTAFDENSHWTSSIVLPLLLITARNELLQASRSIPHFDASDIEVEKVKQEIANLTEAVIATLANRLDALPLFARWSTWLMRQLLMQEIKKIDDVRSSAYVDAALINAIGSELKKKNVNPAFPSNDVPTWEAWEAWCYRCVLASHANNGFIAVPDCESFLKEWKISFDDWPGEQGKQLRRHADLFTGVAKEIPSGAAHYLAYPIAMSETPVDAWIELWATTQLLREIVEFGDADDSESDKYQSSTEADKLLLLAFSIGLAVLDQLVSKCSTGDSPQARDLAKLHEALASAVREMLEINYFLSREQWLQAIKHLAVRRLIWEDRASEVGKNKRFSIFLPDDEPTFSDYLSAAKNDVMELLAVLQMTRLNESDRKIVKDKLNTASIDLSEVIATAKRLNGISARKYPIDQGQLREITEAYRL